MQIRKVIILETTDIVLLQIARHDSAGSRSAHFVARFIRLKASDWSFVRMSRQDLCAEEYIIASSFRRKLPKAWFDKIGKETS